MDAVFEMYVAKELEVLIKPASTLRMQEKPIEISRGASPQGNSYFLSGAEHGAKENQDAYSKRTPGIQDGPTRDGPASPQP
jgi:hypothetical protein